MTLSHAIAQAGSKMIQNWKQWEGQVLDGKFPLREYLGGSEHSAVFLTEDREHGLEKAAIKLIPADPENAKLQLSRWKAAAQLAHPQLVRLFQMGRCQLGNSDVLYVLMDYAELDLGQILQGGPLSPGEAQETLKLILNALAYLHGKGFVHGHLKPASIMAVDKQLRLSSDGLCRIGEPSGNRGAPGVYDPPEAASGTISPAGDVWSLGITVVEALTQHPPAVPGTEEGEPPVPQSLPAPFLEIARNCLRRDPERRWTIARIAAHLEPAAPAPPLPAPKPQVSARLQNVSTWRRYIVPVAAVAIALAVLAGIRLLNRPRTEPQSVQNTMTRSAQPPAQKSSSQQQSSSAARPPQLSLPSRTAVKPPSGGPAQAGVHQKVLPDVPQSALNTIRGTIRVTVKVVVDPSGNVEEATLDFPGPSKYFARQALEAARQWKFSPAKVDGGNPRNELVLEFSFRTTGTEASLLGAPDGNPNR